MSSHPDLQQLLDPAPGAARERVLEHLLDCDDCRRRVASEDPTRLFPLLSLDPVPAAVLDRVSTSVAATLPERASGGAWRYASLAASIFLGVALGAYLWTDRATATPDRADLAEASVAEGIAPAVRVELLSNRDQARVWDLSMGETQLVMIFDEGLDL